MKYYTEEEMSGALQRACCTIDALTKSCENYTRGVNDCFALVIEYDKELRGNTKARDIINKPYGSVKGWYRNLLDTGHTIESYSEYCGYEVVKNKRPKLGDVAYNSGTMVNNGAFWVSTNENNSGTGVVRQALFLERRVTLIVRPVRSL
jgi:hypothetical protein